jgi:ribosomal protein S27E
VSEAPVGNIVDLRPVKCEEAEVPHLAGTFICGACHHEWTGVAPVGSLHVDCPKCGRMLGAPKNVVEPDVISSDWAD